MAKHSFITGEHIGGINFDSRKPPIGIIPKELWIEQRKLELKAAIKRYFEADFKVPIEWIEELNSYQKS
ncbi:hypothetical protein [Enterococcus devriesei]|uniref:hypothetical protein n=1 Tax=Enterococcus devriesei TaxID=319970 RepID=UPI0028E9CA1E|nr:hypothetical protein [Enterococcus devriesei]